LVNDRYWSSVAYCDSDTPDCSPIEGEALAVAWALDDTEFFTLGCNNLIIATDHKPLVKIYGDRSLDEIINTRIFRLKERTLAWRFKVIYVPGKSIPASDATSCNPDTSRLKYEETHHADGSMKVMLCQPFAPRWMKLNLSAGTV